MTKLQDATILIDGLILALNNVLKNEPLRDSTKAAVGALLVDAVDQNIELKSAAKEPACTY